MVKKTMMVWPAGQQIELTQRLGDPDHRRQGKKAGQKGQRHGAKNIAFDARHTAAISGRVKGFSHFCARRAGGLTFARGPDAPARPAIS
jgi:hypothetical protein